MFINRDPLVARLSLLSDQKSLANNPNEFVEDAGNADLMRNAQVNNMRRDERTAKGIAIRLRVEIVKPLTAVSRQGETDIHRIGMRARSECDPNVTQARQSARECAPRPGSWRRATVADSSRRSSLAGNYNHHHFLAAPISDSKVILNDRL